MDCILPGESHSPAFSDADGVNKELLVLVDHQDQVCGTEGKLEVHRQGLLHRAFSILVFDSGGRLLLQRRAGCKYHFAGLWSNTCCGHPRPGEDTPAAASRRLQEELGFSVILEEVEELIYRAEDGVSGLVEHEYLHVFRGLFDGNPYPNPDEVGAWRWMKIERIGQLLTKYPRIFTPWFALLFRRLYPAVAGTELR